MHHRKPSREDSALALLRDNLHRARPSYAALWPDGEGWVPLPELQAAAGAQHGARLKALRGRGHTIANVMLWNDVAGEQWSWYRLEYDVGDAPAAPRQIKRDPPTSTSESFRDTTLFGDIAPDRSYRQ